MLLEIFGFFDISEVVKILENFDPKMVDSQKSIFFVEKRSDAS
jgi:hypothetical protein